MSNSLSSRDASTANKENTQRLAQMVNDFEILKRQNDALKNFILGYAYALGIYERENTGRYTVNIEM